MDDALTGLPQVSLDNEQQPGILVSLFVLVNEISRLTRHAHAFHCISFHFDSIRFVCCTLENDSVDGPVVKAETSESVASGNAASAAPITASSDSNDCSPTKMSRLRHHVAGAAGAKPDSAAQSKSKSDSASAKNSGSAPHSATSSTSQMQTPPADQARGGALSEDTETATATGEGARGAAATTKKRKKKKNKQKRREKEREKRAAALAAASANRATAPGGGAKGGEQAQEADAKANRRVSESETDSDTDASEQGAATNLPEKKSVEDTTDAPMPAAGSSMDVEDLPISTLALDSKKASSITTPKSASASTTSGVGSSGTSTSRETTQRGKIHCMFYLSQDYIFIHCIVLKLYI